MILSDINLLPFFVILETSRIFLGFKLFVPCFLDFHSSESATLCISNYLFIIAFFSNLHNLQNIQGIYLSSLSFLYFALAFLVTNSIGNPKITLIDLSSDDEISDSSSRVEAELINPINLEVSCLEIRKPTMSIVELRDPNEVRNL